MCRQWAKILWLGLLMYKASLSEVLASDRDLVSSVAQSSPAAVRRRAADSLPDVVLKGIIVVKLETVTYMRELEYRKRNLTKRFVLLCEREMSKLFDSIKGKQTVKIESFRRGRRNKLIVVMDLDSTGNENVREISEIIEKKIKIPGKFAHYGVNKRMVMFQAHSVCCQPKVHYSFDVQGHDDKVYDDSGYDNNGETKGEMHVANKGKCGKAVKFKNSFVYLRNFKQAQTPGTDSITIMFWIKLLTPRSNSSILRSYFDGAVTEVALDDGVVKWRYITSHERTAFLMRYEKPLRLGYWTHIACIYDPYRRTVKMYIDTKLSTQGIVTKGLVNWRFTSQLRFGLTSSEGYLDDLYVYDCVLGEDVIKDIKQKCWCEERCAPRGKNEFLIRMKLVSTNNSRQSTDKIADDVRNEIKEMFDDTTGAQRVQTIDYRPVDVDAIMVDYSLESIGNSNTRYLSGVLQPAITSGRFGDVQLASNDVTFAPISGKDVCRSSEMKCNDGECINKLWKCDGEINCADGSDEINCGNTIDMDCNKEEYRCSKSKILGISECVRNNYRCDGQLDCEDDSDEQGCVAPRLITAPRSLMILADGETATCSCVAYGVPAPQVTWHYKGRKVVSKEGKILVSSVSGRGSLTVFNLTPADSGDYICKVRDNRVKKVIAPSCTIKVRAFGKVCGPPFFNKVAQRSSECLQCFCHERTVNCKSAQMYKFKLSSDWDCSECKDDMPRLVDENGQTVSLLDPKIPKTASYYWELPRKYVGNKLTSYGGLLTFIRDSKLIQSWPSRLKRNVLLNKDHSEPTIANYVTETNYQTFWSNDPPSTHNVNNVPKIKPRSYNKDVFNVHDTLSGPRVLNLTGQYVAVIVGTDGTHLVSKKPLDFNKSLIEIKMTEDSWKENRNGITATRQTFLRVLTNIKYIFINARSSGAFVSRPISISLDTTTEELNGNEEVVSVEHCACPQGYEGLSCQNCAMGYYRSKLTNECVKCFCFNHSNVCDPTTGKCQNCDHDTEGSNCQNCKPGYYGNATIGTTADCKLCQCPLDVKTNQFSELCFLDSDGHSTCSECQIGYAGRNCERCAQGYKGNPLEVGGSCYKVGNFSECNMSGSVSQTITTNGKIKCTCKANVMGSVCNECRPGRFNLQASNPSGCEKCFCNSASRTCSSLVGTTKKIEATFTNERFMLTTLYGTQALPHSVEEANGEMFLRKVFPERHDVRNALYWNLPIKFTGSKVASYGGYLEYTVTHSWNETKKLPRTYDVLLMGKKFGIMYAGRQLTKTAYINNKPQTFRVPLHEKFWQFSSRSLVLKSLFVLFLGKIERLLILATPTAQMKETRLHEVKMDIAVENTEDSKKVFHGIERCSCPLGYTGYSCETCVTGFTRSGSGIITGCVKCNCNGHSSYCDRETGECKDCQHNTGGKYCEKCIPGFYGDATSGSEAACRPCACPFTNPPNRFSPTCYLGDDGLPVCDQCPEGHEGKRCERCKESYTGNPEIIGDSCKPVTSCGCNTEGSRTTECDEKTKKCECKRYVQGEKCNECKKGFYNLHGSNDEGCNKCFCMGLKTSCKSSTNFRDQITFIPYSLGLPAGLSITTEDLSQNVSDFVVDFHNKRVRFLNRTWLQRPNIYWTLPRTFLGNQVMSYGGTLSLSYSFYSSQDITYGGNGHIVKIKGNGITLNYRGIRRVPSNKEKDLNIIFLEKHWDNQDGSAVSRFDLMRVLVHTDAIMIRASYGKGTIESSIGQIKMNIPTGEKLGQTKASEVEICECPANYYGSSCEMCAPGYTRMGKAMGLCVPCQCYSHSNECDERTGVCKNCKHNTAGDNCELCARGFYGNTKRGKTKGCKQCPCPLPGSTNRFSETCFIDSDGLPTCDSCQEGYSGRHCEKCSLNYTGNPLTPGGKCFKVLVELIPTVKISPEKITLQEGESARFVCTVKSIRPTQILWSRKDGKPLSSRAIVSGSILSFTSLNKSDAGTYVCAANNDIALRLATTELYVKKQQVTAVIVTVTPKSRYIPVGGTAKFSCTSKTSSRYSITWTRENNNPMSSTTYVDRDGTLIVNDAKLGDGGTYICTGKNTLNIDRAIVSLHVGVVVKPQVAVTPQKQIVDIAQAVKFRCSASAGFPAATLRWKRGDGRQLPRFSKFFRRTGLFKILAASRRDEGEYMCTASNSGGDSVMKVQLLVKGPNSLPRARVTPESLTVDEGNRALLRCHVSGDEKLVVRWRKKDGKLPKSAVVRRHDLEIQKTTFYNAGLYICTVTNRYGRAEAQARLNVNKDTSKPSRVSIKPGGTVITAMEGESLTLECQVAGISKPLVKWTHLLKKQLVGYKRKLDFKKLKLDDTGTYVCSSRTEEGEEASVSVVVQRNKILPQVQVRPNNVAANTGEKVTFTCTTRSAQQPVEVAWSRADGTALSKTHLVRGNVLEIHNIRKEHQGTYICLAKNRFGANKATAELTVFEP